MSLKQYWPQLEKIVNAGGLADDRDCWYKEDPCSVNLTVIHSTVLPAPDPPIPDDMGSDEGDGSGLLVGVIVGVVLGCILIASLVAIIVKKRTSTKRSFVDFQNLDAAELSPTAPQEESLLQASDQAPPPSSAPQSSL
eukprot:Hpha_TRINITY_DN8155_c0_g2::TRINITY_DN8155_c0_g2_i1::g.172037::m.172037